MVTKSQRNLKVSVNFFQGDKHVFEKNSIFGPTFFLLIRSRDLFSAVLCCLFYFTATKILDFCKIMLEGTVIQCLNSDKIAVDHV